MKERRSYPGGGAPGTASFANGNAPGDAVLMQTPASWICILGDNPLYRF